MGGSGGGGAYRFTETDLGRLREEAKDRLLQSKLDAEVNSLLQHELVDMNDRDSDLANARLDEIEDVLGSQVEAFDRTLFGGSVAKHTFVDGISDIDSLVVLDGEGLGDRTPAEVREELRRLLAQHLPMTDVASIESGSLAVTITYQDGEVVQLVPAVQTGDSLAISTSDGQDWSQIRPREFASELTRVNQAQGGAVIPTIKLAKAILHESVPEEIRPQGYHVEALALEAFADYTGARSPKSMLEHFFARASDRVLRPITDVTGQSVHLDDWYGGASSEQRRALARQLIDVSRRMREAQSADDWKSLLPDD